MKAARCFSASSRDVATASSIRWSVRCLGFRLRTSTNRSSPESQSSTLRAKVTLSKSKLNMSSRRFRIPKNTDDSTSMSDTTIALIGFGSGSPSFAAGCFRSTATASVIVSSPGFSKARSIRVSPPCRACSTRSTSIVPDRLPVLASGVHVTSAAPDFSSAPGNGNSTSCRPRVIGCSPLKPAPLSPPSAPRAASMNTNSSSSGSFGCGL